MEVVRWGWQKHNKTKSLFPLPAFLALFKWEKRFLQSLRQSPFLVHQCLVFKNKHRIEIKTVAFSVPWQGSPDVGRTEERRKGKNADVGGEEKQGSEKEKKGKGPRKRREGAGPRGTGYLLCFANKQLNGCHFSTWDFLFPGYRELAFNGNNELIE